ncbi:MAG: hypothetical protein QF921_03430 [Pseudomonadales bacterium]|jgi:hypothetical protein|nr:hypothetical protein [Pseudomonadales bacterium]MDP6470549.1 hypothetical protein [Pseudomonadales bacterium]MDP6827851.1 hypothetical protein [Pseudomonadales bacterium]MDP6970560.1 hypothetical protein [Pseudomonadales bacterium]|tara:strand:- start:2231 stop:2464 length:234 start_codon:yes stop_codon:yes gene_type:complete
MQTLADLKDSFHLYAVCVTCKRMKSLTIVKLMDALGADYPVTRLRDRLRCKQCYRRTGDLRIVYVGPDANAAGFHYR